MHLHYRLANLYSRAMFVRFPQEGCRVLGFDIWTGTVPQLVTSTSWKVARSAGVASGWVDPLNLFMDISRGKGQTF